MEHNAIEEIESETAGGRFIARAWPVIFSTLCLGVIGAAFSTYMAVHDLTNQVAQHDHRLSEIETKQIQFVTKQEQLDTAKRIEQQLEILMLRAGISPSKILLSQESK